MTNTFLIGQIGLEGQDRIVVNTATKLLSHDGVSYQMLEDNPLRAHLLILDEDSYQGKTALRQSRPGQVKLVVSSRPTQARNIIGVPRPVELNFLKSVLKRLYSKLQSQAEAQLNAQAKKHSPTQAIETLRGTLFNILLEAREKKEILHIACQNLPELFIDGRNHCMATTASDAELIALINTSLQTFSIQRMNPESFAVHSNELSIQSLYNLLWLAGIKCSCGRMLPGHQMDRPFRLRAWPNFTRNSFIADHLKLAAVLAKTSMNISQLSELTQVSLSDVINFYNAAYAVELIEFRHADAQASSSPVPRQLARQGLLAKIAKRLKIKGIF